VADLTGRIDHLVGRLTAGAAPGHPGPTGESPPELRQHDPKFPDRVAGLLAMPLDEYEREGAPLEIRVPWLDNTLWFVPADADADRLGGEAVGRGRIWTAAELGRLMALPGVTLEVVETLARAKLAVDGDIVEVRGR